MRDLLLNLLLLLLHVRQASSSLRPQLTDDSAPPVFCLDVGIEIAFPSRDVEDALGGATAASTGGGCLRSSPMNAVIGHLKTSLRTFSLHAVDCVLEPADVESSTTPLMGIASVCSRSNVDVQEDMQSWGRETRRQVDKLFESEKKVLFDQITGMVGQVAVSPAYELPTSGSGLPQFLLGETEIWSEGGDDGDEKFFSYVQLDVKNDGKTPLHLYRLTLVEKGSDKATGFVLPLVAPAVVLPDTSQVVSFKAITEAAVDSARSYLLYISHSGFRSHVFEGVLDGRKFLAREEAVQPQGEDSLFDRFSLDSVGAQSLFSSFPYATWQVASMAVVVAVGLAVTLYIRRKRHSARLMGRVVTSCLRSPEKKAARETGGRTSAKPVSNRVASSRAAISKSGEDHIEMESLIKKPLATANAAGKLTRPKMPAIKMKWKAPPPPPPRATVPATDKTSLAVPKAMATKRLRLDLDRAAKLHPKRFESMWDEYVERFQSDLPDSKRPGSDELLNKMKTHGISCMASGTVNGVEKYVFYAKQRGHSWFFLVTVDVTVATSTSVVTVRASSEAAEDLMLQLVELLKKTIAEAATS